MATVEAIEWTDVIEMSRLQGAGATPIVAGGRPLVVVRDGVDVYVADGICPHKFGQLSDGTCEGRHLTCPVHAATFDLATGDPGAGDEFAGHLRTYPARVSGDVVQAVLPRD